MDRVTSGMGPVATSGTPVTGSLNETPERQRADSSMRHVRHWPALDGLRALAITAVIGLHMGVLPGGYLGVDVFFVLSGFLITSLLIDEWDKRGERISFRRFYMRRVLRLLPALGCVILGAAIFAAILYLIGGPADRPFAHATLSAIPWVVVFASNLNQVLHPGQVNALTPTWSLAVEEQFYLAWPAVFVLLMRRRISRRRLALALSVLAVADMAYRTILSAHLGYRHDRIYFATDTHADGLLLGCSLAVYLASNQSALLRKARSRPMVGSAWLAAAVLGVLFLFGHGADTAFDVSAAVLASAVIVAAIATGQLPKHVEQLLNSRWAIWLGRRSYGLYLWNSFTISIAEALCAPYTGIFPAGLGWRRFIFAMALTAALAAALIMTTLSYRFIELPALRLKRRFQG